MAKKLITIKLAAEILGVSVETLRNWDKTGRLKAERGKKNSYRLYDISALEKYARDSGLKRRLPAKLKLVA